MVNDKNIWEALLRLEGKGYIEKVCRGAYRITEEGMRAYEEMKKLEAAERAASIKKVIEALRERMMKTISYMSPLLTESKIEALAKFYGIALTFGLYKPLDEKIISIVDALMSSFKSIALTPPTEGEEEEEAFIEALLVFLNHLLKCRSLREKIAKERKLTFLLNMDFSHVQLSDEDLRAALYFALVYQGLHREGKV